MLHFISPFLLLLFFTACTAQTQRVVGGLCQGCDALFEYGDQQLSPTDTLAGFESTEPKLKLTGTVYQNDGKTPASDIVIYIYHTDRNGIYPKKESAKGWASRHGFIRGWIKTDASGRYTFYTFRPAAYPNRRAPEHIHMTVKEPNTIPYYIEDIFFEDDPLLTPAERKKLKNRGGSGLVRPEKEKNIYNIQRDIILGKNIPDY